MALLEGGTAVVRVIADASKLNATIMQATRGSTSGLSRAGAAISSALSNPIVEAGLVVAGVTAKMGFDFEDAFTRIDAISNASSQDIARWKKEIMGLSHETAQSPKELADALYFLASAGLKANAVFPALEASAKASAVGLGDVAQVGSVVAAVLNAYAKSGITATDVTDTLLAAVRESRAETDEFGQVVGRLLPISARAGISFGELAGSLASLSNIGLDVYEAATAMRAATQAIVAPGEKAANTMESLGLSAQDLLDAIHKRGLLGALQLLDSTIKDNTTSESDYLRTFRDIIPNIRALTGVLGLTGENAKHVQSIFLATTHATGDLGDSLRQVKEGPAFQFRQALNDLKITGVEVGTHVLPLITGALKLLDPVLKLVADHAGQLLVAFLGWKALGFLPLLLGGVAGALEGAGLGAASGAAAAAGAYKFGQAATYMSTATAEASGAAGGLALALRGVSASGARAVAGSALLAYQLGDTAAAASTSKTDLEHLNSLANTYYGIIRAGNKDSAYNLASLQGQADMYHGNAIALQYAAENGISYSDALWLVSYAGDELNKHQKAVNRSLHQAVGPMNTVKTKTREVTKAFERWGFSSDKAFSQFKEDLAKSVQVSVGQFEHLSDAFKTTPSELQTQLSLAVNIAQRYHNDLKAIFGSKDLTKTQKKALAALPADQRDAWVHADAAGRQGLTRMATHLFHLNTTNIGHLVNDTKTKLKSGGQTSGHNFGVGLAAGISASNAIAAAASARIAHIIIETARGILKEGSPSREGAKTGAWYVEGIIKGLMSREAALTNAAGHVADVMAHQLENARSHLKDIIDKIKQDMQDKKGFTREKFLERIAHDAGVAAARVAVEVARARVKQAHDLEKMVSQAEKALNRIVDKFKEFKSAIKDGFSDFADLGSTISDAWSQYQQDLKDYQDAVAAYAADTTHGPDDKPPTAPTAPNFQQLIQDQVANAQRLAKDLQDAAAAGLSKELLAQFAGQGSSGADALEQLLQNPALIAQLNDAAKVINAAANNTASALGNRFFGEAIRDATKEFKDATVALRGFIRAMAIILQGIGAAGQLRHILERLHQGMQNQGGGGGGNDGGGTGTGPFDTGWNNQMSHVPPGTSPPIIVHYHQHGALIGSVPQQVVDALDEGLSQKRRTNGKLALDKH